MIRRRSPLFWMITAAAVITTVWWSLHIPRTPERIYNAIPVQAVFVSAHSGLASRWDDVGANPLVRAFFAKANMSANDWNKLGRDPQFRDWLSRLASDEFVVAFVPNLVNTGDGIVFASWLGGGSQRLRLALQWSKIPGIEFAGTVRGWPVWVATSKMFRGGERLTFSLVEGMLVGCYSKDDRCIETVLKCIDGLDPSLGRTNPAAIPSADTADRGWFKIPAAGRGTLGAPRQNFSFASMTSNKVAGVLRVAAPWFDGIPPLKDPPPADLARWQNDLPAAVMILPSARTSWELMHQFPDPVTAAGVQLIAGQTQGPLFLSLCTGDYGGNLFGMKLPSLLVSAASTNAGALPASLSAQVARLNSSCRWNLMLAEVPASPSSIWAVASTGSVLYASATIDGVIGFTAGSNWVTAASSSGGLTNILRDVIIRANRPARLQLAAGSAARANASAYAWFNLPDASRAIRTGLGAYTTSQLGQGHESARELRATMRSIRDWLNALEALGEIEITAHPLPGATEIRFATKPVAP